MRLFHKRSRTLYEWRRAAAPSVSSIVSASGMLTVLPLTGPSSSTTNCDAVRPASRSGVVVPLTAAAAVFLTGLACRWLAPALKRALVHESRVAEGAGCVAGAGRRRCWGGARSARPGAERDQQGHGACAASRSGQNKIGKATANAHRPAGRARRAGQGSTRSASTHKQGTATIPPVMFGKPLLNNVVRIDHAQFHK